ncbi:MAG: MgtC/SapB family protein, partial [Flavitalea sp.]
MITYNEIIIRLIVAFLAGGLIGAEREYMSKAAGFRTLIMISLGSAIFSIVSILMGSSESHDRIASNIVTGIGFLGAGVIFKEDNKVKGLTTAASVWATAAIGMGIGNGNYFLSLSGTALVFLSLSVLTNLEEIIERRNQVREYRLVTHLDKETLWKYEELMKECKLHFKRNKQNLSGERLTGTWSVSGSEKRHQKFIERIINDSSVKEF